MSSAIAGVLHSEIQRVQAAVGAGDTVDASGRKGIDLVYTCVAVAEVVLRLSSTKQGKVRIRDLKLNLQKESPGRAFRVADLVTGPSVAWSPSWAREKGKPAKEERTREVLAVAILLSCNFASGNLCEIDLESAGLDAVLTGMMCGAFCPSANVPQFATRLFDMLLKNGTISRNAHSLFCKIMWKSSSGSAREGISVGLSKLNLSCNQVTGRSDLLGDIIEGNPGLKELNLGYTDLGVEEVAKDKDTVMNTGFSFKENTGALKSLCSALQKIGMKSKLDRLLLPGNGLGAESADVIAGLLSCGRCKIAVLDLAYNSFNLPPQKGNARVESGDMKSHPILRIVADGLRSKGSSSGGKGNDSLEALDLTGSCRFGLLNPALSEELDDRDVNGRLVTRGKVDRSIPNKMSASLVDMLGEALEINSKPSILRFGENEINRDTLLGMQTRMNAGKGRASKRRKVAS